MLGVSEMHILSLHFWSFEGRFALPPQKKILSQNQILSQNLLEKSFDALLFSINIQDSRSQPSPFCHPRH